MASTEITQAQQAELEALQAAQQVQYDLADQQQSMRVPILKIAQPQTKDLRRLDAEPGEFIDTVLEETLGNEVEFIPVFYQLGRFYGPQGAGRAWSTLDFDTIPETWSEAPAVDGKGNFEPFVGTPFAEHPDAEERFKERVNAKEIPWGSGPPIQTSHNFTGLVVVPGLDDDEDNDLRPVRLSLRSSQVPSARRMAQLTRMRRGNPWDVVLDLSTKVKEWQKSNSESYLLQVKQGRKANDAERAAAVELFIQVGRGLVEDNAERAESDDKAAVESKGLAV